ncbi:hypothetical protein [Sphingopyxis sp. Root1497]|jgi:hypothetical protein|uniref:hypothetical protein n=1 Tax=Sphingopyxis sp. Root1497 TaxID=1736474 RepID=UPI001910E352|nr:hypothetical protein [Sphingopyxis sp. Root1497]
MSAGWRGVMPVGKADNREWLAQFRGRRAMRLAMREWWAMETWRVPLSVVAFGALLGVMGPFGSQTVLGPVARFTFWTLIALVGFGAAAAAGRVLASVSHPKRRRSRTITSCLHLL